MICFRSWKALVWRGLRWSLAPCPAVGVMMCLPEGSGKCHTFCTRVTHTSEVGNFLVDQERNSDGCEAVL